MKIDMNKLFLIALIILLSCSDEERHEDFMRDMRNQSTLYRRAYYQGMNNVLELVIEEKKSGQRISKELMELKFTRDSLSFFKERLLIEK